MLRTGFPRDDPPIEKVEKISPQAVNELIRAQEAEWQALESFSMAKVPTDADMEKLRSRVALVAKREVSRLADDQRRGKLDIDRLGRLASAVERIERMETAATKRRPKRAVPTTPAAPPPTTETPPTFADTLLRKGAASEADAPDLGSAPAVAVP